MSGTTKLLLVQPANPLAPTVKELEEATDLTPYLAPRTRIERCGNLEVHIPIKEQP